MRARIFRQPKNAMQSGQAKSDTWMLTWEPEERERNDPMMGWPGGTQTQRQVRLRFDTREEAVDYATRNAIPYEIELPPPPKVMKPKVYADNFRWGRSENWTH